MKINYKILLNLLLITVLIIIFKKIISENKQVREKNKIYDFDILFNYFIKICIILTIFTLIYMNFDYKHWNGINQIDDKSFFKKILNRLYFTAITFTSVGYGDITPKSNINRIITIIFNIIILLIILEFIQLNLVIKHI